MSAATLKLDDFKENELTVMTDKTPRKSKTILLGIDPRSPTVEFTRTPIIVNVSESETVEKIHNKNLDRVKRSVIITPKSTSRKQVSEKISPKLLESSPLKVKSNNIKRKSFVGLLETNIDYTETDLDAVIREKNKIKETPCKLSEPVTPIHKQCITVIQKESIDPRSPTNDFIRTPIQIIKKNSDLDSDNKTDFENETVCVQKEIKQDNFAVELEDHKIIQKCVQEICETVHLNNELQTTENQLLYTEVHYEHTEQSEIFQVIVPNSSKGNEDTEESEDDNLFTTETPVETKSAPITPPAAKNNFRILESTIVKEIKSAPVTPPITNLIANVKEFDKKLTNLIYHDDDIVICPRKVKLKDYDTRSPLRNINSNEPEKKKPQKLKVKENTKSEYAVSKIPVFKEKGKKTEVQCENTPPRNMEKRKVKVRKSHWDNADTTLII